MAYGTIKRDRRKVARAALRSVLRPGKPFPEHAARRLAMFAEVYRRRGGALYQGWVCLAGRRSTRRPGQGCSEASGKTLTEALRRAALDFARGLKGR